MSKLLAFWAGVTAASWAVTRIRKAGGVAYEYHGWKWLAVPYYLAKGVWQAR